MSEFQTASGDLMSAEEVAQLGRVSAETIRRLAREEQIPGAFRIGAQWRFPRRAAMRWLGLEEPAAQPAASEEDVP